MKLKKTPLQFSYSVILLVGLTFIMSTFMFNSVSATITDTDTQLISYWNFDAGTGTSLVDVAKGVNNATANSSNWVTGKNGNALNFTYGTGSDITTGKQLDFERNEPFSFNLWIKKNQSADDDVVFWNTADDMVFRGIQFTINTTGFPRIALVNNWCNGNGDCIIKDSSIPVPFDVWVMLTMTYDGSSTKEGLKLYINGTDAGTGYSLGTPLTDTIVSVATQYIGRGRDTRFRGIIDEFGVWTRELSQTDITTLYNSGTGNFYSFNKAYTSSLSIPLNNTNFTTTTISLNATLTPSGEDNKNATIYLWYPNSTLITSVKNTTTGSNTVVFNWTLSNLPDAVSIRWNVFGCGGDTLGSNCSWSATNFTFTVDTTAPTISITKPTNNSYVYSTNSTYTTFNFNATSTNSNLAFCWYNSTWDATKRLYTCNIQQQLNLTNVFGKQYIQSWANDSFGNTNMNQIAFSVVKATYNNTVSVLSSQNYVLNISLFNSNSVSSAKLTWNNTEYNSAISTDTNSNYILTNSIDIPAYSNSVIQLYWNITLNNGEILNSSIYNQTITSLSIDDCSVYTLKILNLTVYDEDTNAFLNLSNSIINGSIGVSVRLYNDNSPDIYLSYSTTKTNTNPISICIPTGNLTGTTYSMDADIQYTSTNRVTRWNYVRNYLLTTTTAPDNLILRDLLTTESQEFKITYKDNNFLLVPNVVIDIQKYYVGSGTYYTVENGLTDSYGTTIGHFILGTDKYLLNVYQDGVLIATFTDIQPVCNNIATGDCQINLNILSSSYQFTNWLTYNNLNYYYNFSESNRRLILTWNLPTISYGSSIIRLLVTTYGVLGSSTICDISTTGTLGIYTCNINQTFGNTTIQADLYKDNKFVSTNFFTITNGEQEVFGNTGLILAFIFVICMSLMFTASPTTSIIGGVFGLIVVGLLHLVNFANNTTGNTVLAYSSGIIFIIIAAIAIIWKINSNSGGTS